MSVAIITGSAGLIGSEAARYFAGQGMDVVGIDNDMRRCFFGPEASTGPQRERLERDLGAQYRHLDEDIRDAAAIDRVASIVAAELARQRTPVVVVSALGGATDALLGLTKAAVRNDKGGVDAGLAERIVLRDDFRALALQVAQQSIVLLAERL